jgi:hypothetical protein
MIRGSIEVVTSDSVQGWIYTEDQRIREKVLLAFWADKCVGSGKVSVFRSDLANAGLGDGYLGFRFPISVQEEAVGAIVIRLEGSDAVLLQPGAQVQTRAAGTGLDRATVSARLAALKWSLTHCRITQADFDFLRILWSFGVYERTLSRHAGNGHAQRDTPLSVAADLLESYLGVDCEVSTVEGVTAAGFRTELAKIARNPKLAPIVAVSSKVRAVVRVLEGSHVGDPALPKIGSGSPSVDYMASAENLIMLDSRVIAELLLPADKAIDVITASALLS